MPSVKNNFLKGRMNKDLDDRLVPQGEYRDAKNIRISKSDTEDAGVVQNIKGTTSKLNLGLADDYEVIGYYFSEARNEIIFFSTNNTNHRIDLYDIDTNTDYILTSGSYLNFHKDNLITGINVIDDLLFFTDNRNQPRKLNLETAKSDSTFYNEDKISVAKFAPYKAPTFTMSNDSSITGDYIKERFVRFSYRYKYKDNEYSVLAPFTQIAFQMGDGSQDAEAGNQLSSDEITKAYKSTILEKMVNGANKVVLDIPLPSSNPTSDYEIIEVDVLIKDSNSAAVRILETLDITDSTGDEITYTYKSSLPTKTLPADQVTRVSDKVPVRALAQEVAGNRIIYGNITENITFNEYNEIAEDGKLPVINYTVAYEPKDTVKDGETAANTDFDHLPHHSIKQRRTYQVGIVLADKYGRQSPVILSENSTIYVPAKDSTFDSEDWVGDCLTVTFDPYTSGTNNIVDPAHVYNETTNPYGWYSYRFVVKQLEQEYYNVYTPGAVKYEDTGYLTLHGDNINKVPQSVGGASTDTKLGASDTRLYPKIINKSTYTFKGFELNASGQIVFKKVKLRKEGTGARTLNYTPAIVFSQDGAYNEGGNIYRQSGTTYRLKLKADWTTSDPDILAPRHPSTGDLLFSSHTLVPTSALVFVNGQLVTGNDPTFTFEAFSGSSPAVDWDTKMVFSTALDAGTIDVILTYNGVSVSSTSEFEMLSKDVTALKSTLIGQFEVDETDEEFKIGLQNAGDNPQSQSFDINEITQKQSDGGLINVVGLGTLDLFKDIDISDYVSSEIGFYEKDSKHLIASLSDTTDFLTLENYTGTQRGGAAVDLAVFETEPRQSALDLFFEGSTSDTVDGLIEDLNTENNVEFDCAAAGISGFAVAVDGTITAPTATLGTIDSITYVGATGDPASYASVGSDTVRTANVFITPPSSGYSNSGGTNITCAVTATQLATVAPLDVDDTAAVSVTHTGFTANADVKADGGDTITEKGFYFGTNNTTYNGAGNTKFAVSGASTGDFTRAFTSSDSGFSAGTTRYLWSFVTTDGPGNDEDGPVTVTIPSAPTAPTGVSTNTSTNVTTSSITANGSFTGNGGAAITETGFYIGTNSNYASNTKYPTSPSDTTSPFSYVRSSLSSSTTYYITAYAKNSVGETRGSTISQATAASVSTPSVTTNAETSVTTTGFTANGNVTSDGGASITSRGFYIKQGSSSFTSGDKQTVSGTTGSFSYAKTGANAGETWYYKAFAVNSQGETSGSTETVTTTSNSGTRYLKFVMSASLATGTQIQGNTTVTLSFDYDDIGDPISSAAYHQFGLTNGDPYSTASVNINSISNSNFTATKSFNDPYVKVSYSGNYPNIGVGETETVTITATTSNILQYDATVQFSGTVSNSSFSNSPANLTRTADEDTAFTAMTRTYSPNSGYHFENVGDISITLPSPNPDSIGVSKAKVGDDIVLTITGNVGQDDTTSTVTVSGNARANDATSVTVQYSTSSASGPWSTLTSGANPGIAVDPSGVAYVKITPNGAYTLQNSGVNSSYVSIDDTSNTSGNAQVHTFTYGNNTSGSNKKINVNVLGGTTNIFTITSTLSTGQ
jgi:hypothetical protein